MANSAPVRASSITSPVSDENSTLTPAARVIVSGGGHDQLSASTISPRPIRTRPILADPSVCG